VRRWLVGRAATAQGPIRSLAQVGHFRIGQTHDPANSRHAGRLVGDIAREQQRDAHDVLFDIVVADDLRTHLWPETAPDTEAIWELRARFLRDSRTLLGGSDAGAHLDRMCGARYPTELLAEGVRRFGALSLEEAVRMLTAEPARLLGLRDRGRVVAGAHADLVVFDARTVAPLPIHEVADLPGGCERLTSEAIGIEHVLVAGTGIVEGGVLTGARPGTVLRSGRDTDTVAPPPPVG
jgi:N-acyl-D-aspartate/D-glutamate deacylase